VQNQFGATLGGPIVKNRTFFFFNYERFTRRNGIPFSGKVPTPAELSGDFRADPPIYDPFTRQQFTCAGVLNVICPNRIDATANVMANVLHYWPVPNVNLAGGAINYSANAAAGVDTNQYDARIDQIVSEKQRLFGRYTYWKINTHPTQYIFGNTSGGPESAVRGLVADHQVVLGDIYSFSPTLIGDLRISYLHAYTPITPANNNVDLAQFGPFWAAISSSLTHQQFPAPYIVSTIPSPFAGLDVTNNDSGNTYALAASITKLTGRHTLKFGADVRRYQFREGQTIFAPGFFIFAGIFTGGALSPPGSGATPIADFVLGDITPAPGESGFQTALTSHATQWYQGYYFQDVFRMSSKVTFNAGVRWEIPGSYTEEKDLNTVLLPQLQNPLVLVNSPQYPSRHDLELHNHLIAPPGWIRLPVSPPDGVARRIRDQFLTPRGRGRRPVGVPDQYGLHRCTLWSHLEQSASRAAAAAANRSQPERIRHLPGAEHSKPDPKSAVSLCSTMELEHSAGAWIGVHVPDRLSWFPGRTYPPRDTYARSWRSRRRSESALSPVLFAWTRFAPAHPERTALRSDATSLSVVSAG
jgi:hypothetical protein